MLRSKSIYLLIIVLSASCASVLNAFNHENDEYRLTEKTGSRIPLNARFTKASPDIDREIPLVNYTSYCRYEGVLRFEKIEKPVTITAIGYRNSHLTQINKDRECRYLDNIRKAKGIAILLPGLGLPRASMIHYANVLADNGFAPILMDSPCLRIDSGGKYIPNFGGAICLSNALGKIDEGIPIILIGYSYGGSIAIAASALNTKVSAVAAIAPVASWESLKFWTGQDKSPSDEAALPIAGSVPRSQRITKKGLVSKPEGGSKELAPDILANEISMPVLLIGGKKDNVATAEDLRELSELIPRSSLIMLDTGHPQLLSSKDCNLPNRIIRWIRAVLQ